MASWRQYSSTVQQINDADRVTAYRAAYEQSSQDSKLLQRSSKPKKKTLRQKLTGLIASPHYIIFVVLPLIVIVSLMDDVLILTTDKSSQIDMISLIVKVVIFFVFFVELLITLLQDRAKFSKIFFALDAIALLSLVIDIWMILNDGEVPGAVMALFLARSGRSARAAAKLVCNGLSWQSSVCCSIKHHRFNLACLLSAPHLLTPQSRLTSVSKVFRKRNVEDTDQWDDNAAEAPINTEPRQAGVMGDKLANVISSRFVLFIFLSVVIYAVASSFGSSYIDDDAINGELRILQMNYFNDPLLGQSDLFGSALSLYRASHDEDILKLAIDGTVIINYEDDIAELQEARMETRSVGTLTTIVDVTERVRRDALVSIILIVMLMTLLTIGNMSLHRATCTLVLNPFERMLEMVTSMKRQEGKEIDDDEDEAEAIVDAIKRMKLENRRNIIRTRNAQARAKYFDLRPTHLDQNFHPEKTASKLQFVNASSEDLVSPLDIRKSLLTHQSESDSDIETPMIGRGVINSGDESEGLEPGEEERVRMASESDSSDEDIVEEETENKVEVVVKSENEEDPEPDVAAASSVPAMIEWITHPDTPRPNFVHVFMVTYHSFIKPAELLKSFIGRACLTPQDIDPSLHIMSVEALDRTIQTPVRRRVLGTINLWINDHPGDWVDFDGVPNAEMRSLLLDFCQDVLPNLNMQREAAELEASFNRCIAHFNDDVDTLPVADDAAMEATLLEEPVNAQTSKKRRKKKEDDSIVWAVMEVKDTTKPVPIVDPLSSIETLDNSAATFLKIPAEYMAEQMTLIEEELFSKIRPLELVTQGWMKKNNDVVSPNVMAMIAHFNNVSGYIQAVVLTFPTPKERSVVVEHAIHIASTLFKLGNFNGVMEIISGLSTSAVSRLKKTWGLVASRWMRKFTTINECLSPLSSYKVYRRTIHSTPRPCIPMLGVYLSDLTFTLEGNPAFCDNGWVNMRRQYLVTSIISEIMFFQNESVSQWREQEHDLSLMDPNEATNNKKWKKWRMHGGRFSEKFTLVDRVETFLSTDVPAALIPENDAYARSLEIEPRAKPSV